MPTNLKKGVKQMRTVVIVVAVLVVCIVCYASPMYNIVDIGTIGGSECNATDINELGHVTGYAVTSSARNHAFLWDGTMHDLGALGGNTSYGLLIDDRDWVVGESIASDGSSHSVLFGDGTMTDYGPVGTYLGDDLKIKDKRTNSKGEWIENFLTDEGEFHASVWREGTRLDLGTLPGGDESEAFDIDKQSRIVGYDFHTQTAIIWLDYIPYDLNSMIDPGSGWHLKIATGINESGQITGWGDYEGHTRGYLANPLEPNAIPEPSTLIVFGGGLVTLVLLRRRRRGP